MFKNFNFTRRYVLALLIIAFLAIMAYFNLNKLIESQSDDGSWIHISDHQKLLTQQIALYAIYYRTNELKDVIEKLEKAHILLIADAQNSRELKKVYFSKPHLLDKKMKEFLFHAKRFYNNKDGQSLNHILQNSQVLLKDLEKVVDIYLLKSTHNTNLLKKLELFILLLTLSTLLFEAFFIFMPANKSIQKKNSELIAQKEYLNAVIESSTDAIIAIDTNNTIRTFNKEAQKLFGTRFIDQKMQNSKTLDTIFDNPHAFDLDDKKSIIEHISSCKASPEYTLKRFDQSLFPAKITFGQSTKNKNIKLVLHVKDVSKEKLQDKIVLQQAKFAALGEMIAIIAHQWRQPLAQLNFNYMYIKNKIDYEGIKEELQQNEELIAFMSDTITNFEQFYKKTEDRSFEPSASIEQALKIVQFAFNAQKIEIKKEYLSHYKIYGNANSLSQVILAIFQNMADIAKIRKVLNPHIKVKLFENKTHTILEIQDNLEGINISPIEDIFKPFISKKSRTSTGIGLYMAKMIINDKFKGDIKVNNSDLGAIFTIFIPKKIS